MTDLNHSFNERKMLLLSSHIALTFNCFIFGAFLFFSLLFSLSSILRCLSGSSISRMRSLSSRRLRSRSSCARSARAAWIDFQKFSATLLRFLSALFFASLETMLKVLLLHACPNMVRENVLLRAQIWRCSSKCGYRTCWACISWSCPRSRRRAASAASCCPRPPRSSGPSARRWT